ncbi:hypothetical protein AXE65_01445 [Ventosimonas gracilis]|uniref:Probable peptidoglycan glycosyltransferase FtsW n=1 Tax=Ventosimonas gracilis TaxID=1680762 RepID=A0A139SUZ2_9GAMM|nr:putative lipid II flippase FtsW [Ventosimonas gracilis]KXU38407.1 hypothetical protein AXE65_01445 [Ventosimonas gracilis]
MRRFITDFWHRPSPLRPLSLDWLLLGGCLALMALGLVMITSTSVVADNNPYGYLSRQCLNLLAGVLAGLFFLLIPLRLWQRRQVGWWLWGLSIFLLALLLLVAKPANGALRWFDLGVFKVQPAELVKLFVIIYLAGYLLHRRHNLRSSWKGVLIPIVSLFPLGILLNLQPDFGSILVLMGVAGGMLFLAGLNFRHLLFLAGLAGTLVAWLLLDGGYRIERWMHALDPWADRYGNGYQVIQSLIAFASGGWFGVGLGNSVQKHAYLPEAHTDFILAILGEELGFVGVLACLGLFALVCLRALYIGVRAERAGLLFSALLAYGIALLWMGQVLVNFAVNLGLVPTKGLALPFVSYGGSALLACCASLGLLLRIDWEYQQLPVVPADEPEDDRLPDWLQRLRYD